MARNIVGLAGSINRPSRTTVLVEAAVERAAERFGRNPVVIELAAIAGSLGSAARISELDPTATAAIELLVEADALVVASPVHKGGYGGLFKHLFDLLDPFALTGKPVLLGATGGGTRHALVIEHQLRPLLGFFEAQTLATGVYATDADFQEGRIVSAALHDRLDRAVGQFSPFLTPLHSGLAERNRALAAVAL